MGDAWRLGHRPALDGLRGIAVLLVVFEHALYGTFPQVGNFGVVGVTMFFALSGFLITSLLLEERAARGRFSLPAFYRRRALRLMPAMLLTVAINAAIMVWLGNTDDWSLVWGTLTYTSNFVMADGDWPRYGLGHTWSLAIEEQFYLIWPLLLIALARLPRRWMLLAVGYGSVCALLLRWYYADVALVDPARIYFGLDTRADSLLIGCGLAFILHGRATRTPTRGLLWVGVLLLVWTGTLAPRPAELLTPFTAAVGAAVVMWVAAQSDVRWLHPRWLVYVGRRSYGLYLLQAVVGGIPVILFGDSLAVMLLVMLPVSWAAAWASYRWVEQPFLAMKARPLDGLPRGEGDGAVPTIAVLERHA